MSQTDTLAPSVLDAPIAGPRPQTSAQQRRALNAIWAPFLQFKLLLWMLGSTALVAVLLGSFLYFAFSDLIAVVSGQQEETSYYGEMIEIQLVHVLRYCGALFVLYVLLLAAVCVAYTHRLIGPLRPFTRHVERLAAGEYDSRVRLRKGDLEMYAEYAERLNDLAADLEAKRRSAQDGL